MKKSIKTTAIGAMLALGMSACVSTQPIPQVAPGPSGAVLEAEVTRQFSAMRSQTEQGNCQEAERIMRNLLAEFESSNDEWEVTMLTDLCLCHIEQGEISRFVNCSDKLSRYSEGKTILDRETQFVEQLSGYFSNNAGSDARIDSDIRTGFAQTLGKNE